METRHHCHYPQTKQRPHTCPFILTHKNAKHNFPSHRATHTKPNYTTCPTIAHSTRLKITTLNKQLTHTTDARHPGRLQPESTSQKNTTHIYKHKRSLRCHPQTSTYKQIYNRIPLCLESCAEQCYESVLPYVCYFAM